MNNLEKARQALDRALLENARVILALEGGAASGKTTLADQLSRHYAAPVIHMDDFFLPPQMRTQARFEIPGGNIHSERFNVQVAEPLRRDIPFSYDVFDCSKGQMDGKRTVGWDKLIIVEGVYSLHPLYRDIYTHGFFLRIDPALQERRLQARGEWLYQRFRSLWLPLERAYFTVCRPDACCQLLLDSADS